MGPNQQRLAELDAGRLCFQREARGAQQQRAGFYRGIDMAMAKVTTNHDELRKWAEARGGRPAAVRSTQSKDGPGIEANCRPEPSQGRARPAQ